MKAPHRESVVLPASFQEALNPWRMVLRLWGMPLYGNSLFLMTWAAVRALLGFAFWAVAARLYDPEAVGLASAGMAAVSLLGIFALFGLDSSLIRFLPGNTEKPGSLINTVLTTGALTALGAALIFLTGLGVWSPVLLLLLDGPLLRVIGKAYAESATSVLWVVAVAALPTSVNYLFLSIKKVQKRLTVLVGLPLIMTAITLILAWLLLPRLGALGAGIALLAG